MYEPEQDKNVQDKNVRDKNEGDKNEGDKKEHEIKSRHFFFHFINRTRGYIHFYGLYIFLKENTGFH